jgi:precorrin-3B synthase
MPTPGARRGACPTLAKPMQTGDGLLARLRPLDNRLTPAQLRLLAEAASQHGNGIVEITARGSLQVRGLRPETVAPFEAAVLASGIDIVAGLVETPPLAGLDPRELVDMRPIAEALRRAVEEHVPPLVLAPKLAITLDGGGMFHLGGVSADVKAEAFRDGNEIKFLLSVGGRALGVVALNQLVGSITDILEIIAAVGLAARGKDMRFEEVEKPVTVPSEAPTVGVFPLNGHGVCSTPPSVLPDISPTRGENGWGADTAPIAREAEIEFTAVFSPECTDKNVSAAMADEPAASHSPPLWGRCPAGQRGVSLGNTEDEFPDQNTETNFALGLAFPYSQATSAMLIALANAAQVDGADEIRLSPNRGLFLTGLTLGQATQLQQHAVTSGFITTPHDPRRTIALCAGALGCASAFYDTHALAAKILSHAPDLLDGSIALHLSGCAKGCAHPAAAPLAFVGARGGYSLVVNGTASAEPSTYIAENDIDAALQRLQALVRQSKESGETARACLDRLGQRAIATALQLDRT